MEDIELNTQVVGWDNKESPVNNVSGYYAGEYNGRHLIVENSLDHRCSTRLSQWDNIQPLEEPARDEELYDMVQKLKKLYVTKEEMFDALDSLRINRRAS